MVVMQAAIPAGGRDAPMEQPYRVALALRVAGDLRFLSHHDELRMLARTFVRARWPVAYSCGFNPLPRVVLPLPRSVGMASDCEWVLVDLNEERAEGELRQALAAVLPLGVTLLRLIAPAARATLQAQAVTYDVELTPGDAERAALRIRSLLDASIVTVERQRGPNKPMSRIDVRPYIEEIVRDGRRLRMRLLFKQQSSARPSELLTALGLAAGQYTHRVRRSAVEWNIELAGRVQRPAAPERNQLVDPEKELGETSGEEDSKEEGS